MAFLPWTREGFQRTLPTSVAFPWSSSENHLCSRLVSSQTATRVLPSGNPILYPSWSIKARLLLRKEMPVAAVKTQPGLCSAARAGRLSAPLTLLDRHRPFLFTSPHEVDMLLRDANEKGGPK